ncbi:hypothetical protein BJP36_34305 [Moorena producens JHB]|uniref:Uncharacterized protein n=1 Tax=Moorena producens (strain JHB) TaxID=1454205 RepID=A0A1D9G9E3_MOOP1|nr:hypothetical protein [Moorena producens]AOY84247.1 hypothetical protein BJP36_34305 [Moorena producens JHB]
MKIENLDNLQEINTEEFSSLQGGRMIQHPMDIRDMVDIKGIEDLKIAPHRPMPEPKPQPKPPIIARPIPRPHPFPCYYPLPPKCGPVHPYCYVQL